MTDKIIDINKNKKQKKDSVDEYKTNAPFYGSAKVDFLKGIDQRFLNMGKALVTDDIYIQERHTRDKWDPNSNTAQKFFMQSPNYRGIFNLMFFFNIFCYSCRNSSNIFIVKFITNDSSPSISSKLNLI